MRTYRVHLIRHGVSQGNERGLYVGKTDLPLTTDGIKKLERQRQDYVYPNAALFYSSPLERCRKTLELLYPGRPYVTVPGLAECDFGDFEGKSAAELEGDSDFSDWLAGKCGPRGGEDSQTFAQRCAVAFHMIVKDVLTKGETDAVICTHGGVIMSIMASVCLDQRDPLEWRCNSGEGFTLRITPGFWMRSGVAELIGMVPNEERIGDADF